MPICLACATDKAAKIKPVERAFENSVKAIELRKTVDSNHWCSSGFANTDLDLQLKKYGIHKLIVIGLTAHTYVEATVRYAAELGYDVTVVKDATTSYSDEQIHAALDINIPSTRAPS